MELSKLNSRLHKSKGVNPRDVKCKMAEIITILYWGEEETKREIAYVETAFSKKEIPDDIPKLLIVRKKFKISFLS